MKVWHAGLSVTGAFLVLTWAPQAKNLSLDCEVPATTSVEAARLEENSDEEAEFEAAAVIVQFMQIGMVTEKSVASDRVPDTIAASLPATHRASLYELLSRWVPDARWASANALKHGTQISSSRSFAFRSFLCSAGTIVALLLLGIICDATWRYWHWARFTSCQRKIQRVVVASMNHNGDIPLCPCCLQILSRQPSSSIVVFHCGHRLHVKCVNRWLNICPGKVMQCPICDRAPDAAASGSPECDHDLVHDESKTHPCCQGEAEVRQFDDDCSESTKDSDTERPEAIVDCYRSLVLDSLQRDYPEIITDSVAKRWTSCHPQTWFMELRDPAYKSVTNRIMTRIGVSTPSEPGVVPA